jgi:thiosulfate reductase cytochrome b subunit
VQETTPLSMPRSNTETLYYRHRLPVRLMHWINVVCLTILFMSGLSIFNAHPSLYWGDSSYSSRPAILQITSEDTDSAPKGVVRIGAYQINTTGILGVSNGQDGAPVRHAFPSWMTIPGYYSLAYARQWHFFFAWLFVFNGLAFLLFSIWSGHLARDLAPGKVELKGIGASIKDHLRFRHPHGEAAKHYNVLQKLAYLIVIFVLLPLIALMGMAMSPMLDTAIAGWVNWFGGRQSARTIHFIIAWMLVAFVLIHVFEVIVSGLWNHLRSMITGYYDTGPEPAAGVRHENT